MSLSEIAENNQYNKTSSKRYHKERGEKTFRIRRKAIIYEKDVKSRKKIEKVLSELTKIQKDSSDKQIASVLENIKKELNCLV